MAITAATKTSDFSGFLNREQSEAIFEQAAHESVVQRLTRRVALGASGISIPIVTGKISAGWAAEGAAKTVSSATLGLKTMDPKKLTAIAVVSAEVVRANPGGYMDLLRPQIAIGKAWGAIALGKGSRLLALDAQQRPAFIAALNSLGQGSVVPAPGGVLIRDQAGVVLGAIGISGDTSDIDEQCAISAIEGLGLLADAGVTA